MAALVVVVALRALRRAGGTVTELSLKGICAESGQPGGVHLVGLRDAKKHPGSLSGTQCLLRIVHLQPSHRMEVYGRDFYRIGGCDRERRNCEC